MRAALAGLGLVLVLAAPAAAETDVARSGNVRAELSYKVSKLEQRTKGIVLRVFEAGEQIVENEIPDDRFLSPVEVAVRDLEGDGEPEAIFTLFTGGAHCCVLTFIYEGAELLEHDFGNVGYTLEKIGGRLSFVTADDRFSFRYASYAGSLQPLLVQRFQGALVDVTRDPAVRPRLKREALRFKRFYQRAHRNKPELTEAYASPIAAYTADTCNLGNCQKGYALATRAVERGELPALFVKRLERDMDRLGYAR